MAKRGSTVMGAILVPILALLGATDADSELNAGELMEAVALDGFTAVDDPSLPSGELTWAEFADLTGQAVEPTGDDGSPDVSIGVRVWVDDTGESVFVFAATQGDPESAWQMRTGIFDQATSNGVASGEPFEHAATVLFESVPPVTAVIWRQGSFAVMVLHASSRGRHEPVRAASIAREVEQGIRNQTGELPEGFVEPEQTTAYRLGRALAPVVLLSLIVGGPLLARRRIRTPASIGDRPASPWPPPAAPSPLNPGTPRDRDPDHVLKNPR